MVLILKAAVHDAAWVSQERVATIEKEQALEKEKRQRDEKAAREGKGAAIKGIGVRRHNRMLLLASCFVLRNDRDQQWLISLLAGNTASAQEEDSD